ncbi:hypothetical protein E4V51_30870, partial [Paenibacillus sp. 28ISP30-2]|nr:hypothetical protein [Paenibacillus sp. 28ISP30-2]
GTLKLPVIVVYPEYKEKSDIINCESKTVKQQMKKLWDNLPAFRDLKENVPTVHIPNKKELIRVALNDTDFMVNSKCDANIYFYPC